MYSEYIQNMFAHYFVHDEILSEFGKMFTKRRTDYLNIAVTSNGMKGMKLISLEVFRNK